MLLTGLVYDMKWSKDEIGKLLRTLAKTRQHELNCDECLKEVAEFAEKKLASGATPHSLSLIEPHLSICDECKEEYETLLEIMRAELST